MRLEKEGLLLSFNIIIADKILLKNAIGTQKCTNGENK